MTDFKIRRMTEGDEDRVFEMMRPFYDSPAVLEKSPDEILRRDIKDCIGQNPYIEGFVFDTGDDLAGYAMAAISYSTEFGGKCIWLEDLYIKPKYRGRHISTLLFERLENQYFTDAVRFRLEVEDENETAKIVYKKRGYVKSCYDVMNKNCH